MFKHKLFITFFALFLAIAMLVSACSSSVVTTYNGEKTTKTIRIGYQKNGPLFIMKNLGTLEKRLQPMGYSVEWFEFQAGPALLESLNAGSIDFGRTGDSPPIFAQAAGSSLVYVAVGKAKDKGSGVLVKNGSTIKTLTDLKGKTIGFAKGSSSHYLLVHALNKAGLTLKDIKPAYLQPGDARIAFEQGKVDAWIVWDPFSADAEVTGNAHMIVNGTGLTSDRDFLLASPDFAKAHEDVLKATIDEVQKACEWANNNHEALADLLSSRLGIDKASIKKAIERREYGLVPIDNTIIEEQQKVADQFFELGIIPKKLNIAERMYKFK